MIIDTDAQVFSAEDATQILQTIYHLYHGRSVDAVAQRDLMFVVEHYGFLGLAKLFSVVIDSDEMTQRVAEELENLWQAHFKRKPTVRERSQYEPHLRYFRALGREELDSRMRYAIEIQEQANKLTHNGSPAQAQALIESNLDTVIPGWWKLWHDYGLSLLRQGRHHHAMPHYKQAIAYNEDDNEYWSCEDLRVCYEKLGEQDKQWYARGIEYFGELVRQYPRRWSARHALAWLTWKSDGPADAIPLYHEAINVQPDNDWQHSCEGLRMCYEQTGQQEAAYAYFTQLTASRPNLWPAWHSLGLLAWHHKKDQVLAVEYYQKAIDHHPKEGWYWSLMDLGRCLKDLKRFDDAQSVYQQAQRLDPRNPEVPQRLGELAASSNRFAEAIGLFQDALHLNPQLKWSWVGLGNCYLHGAPSHFSLSWLAYMEALAIDPGLEQATIALKELEGQDQPWKELRRLLQNHLKLSDLKAICLDFSFDYEKLGDGDKPDRVVNLLTICRRTAMVPRLLYWIADERPDIIPPILGRSLSSHSPSQAGNTPRAHLETQHGELKDRYDHITRRIAALDIDLGRAIAALPRQVLEEQRREFADQRDAIVAQMARIEEQLSK